MEQKYYKTKDGYVSSNTESDNDIATEITKDEFLLGIEETQKNNRDRTNKEIEKQLKVKNKKERKLSMGSKRNLVTKLLPNY